MIICSFSFSLSVPRLILCSPCHRDNEQYVPDPFIRLFDMRALKALPPLSIPSVNQTKLRFLPAKYESSLPTLLSASAEGILHLIELSGGSAGAIPDSHVYYTELSSHAAVSSMLTTLAVSTSCQYVAVGTSAGGVVQLVVAPNLAMDEDVVVNAVRCS